VTDEAKLCGIPGFVYILLIFFNTKTPLLLIAGKKSGDRIQKNLTFISKNNPTPNTHPQTPKDTITFNSWQEVRRQKSVDRIIWHLLFIQHLVSNIHYNPLWLNSSNTQHSKLKAIQHLTPNPKNQKTQSLLIAGKKSGDRIQKNLTYIKIYPTPST